MSNVVGGGKGYGATGILLHKLKITVQTYQKQYRRGPGGGRGKGKPVNNIEILKLPAWLV